MRTMFLACSFLVALACGCSTVDPPPTEPTQLDDVSGAKAQELNCPTICGLDTQCQFPDGTCREACNPCLCTAHGGTVVKACSASQQSPAPDDGADDSIIGRTCGNTICAAGTFCCNPSCGICVPPGWFCTQQVCTPQD